MISVFYMNLSLTDMAEFFLTCSNKPAILTFVENKAEAIRFSPYMAFVLLRFMRNQSSG